MTPKEIAIMEKYKEKNMKIHENFILNVTFDLNRVEENEKLSKKLMGESYNCNIEMFKELKKARNQIYNFHRENMQKKLKIANNLETKKLIQNQLNDLKLKHERIQNFIDQKIILFRMEKNIEKEHMNFKESPYLQFIDLLTFFSVDTKQFVNYCFKKNRQEKDVEEDISYANIEIRREEIDYLIYKLPRYTTNYKSIRKYYNHLITFLSERNFNYPKKIEEYMYLAQKDLEENYILSSYEAFKKFFENFLNNIKEQMLNSPEDLRKYKIVLLYKAYFTIAEYLKNNGISFPSNIICDIILDQDKNPI